MASISSLGSGSNLPLQDTLDSLRENAELALKPLQERQSSYKSQISAYGMLQQAVSALQKAAAALGKADTLNPVKATSSDDKIATVSSKTGALPGQYTVTVEQLATTERLRSGEPTSRTEQHSTGGTIEIKVGDKTQTIELGDDTSLNGIVKAINGDDDALVHATLINNGTDDGSYLMLTSKTEGEDGAIASITVTDNDDVAAILSYEAGGDDNALTVQQEAKNAKLTVNDVEVTSSSNTVTDILDGVTLNLVKTTDTDAGESITITVASDTDATEKSIRDFVTAYNSLQSTISNLTAFDVGSETQSALTGDSTTRSIQQSIASALRVNTSEGVLRSLGELGITTDINSSIKGQLTIDGDKLKQALKDNPADVTRLFAGPGGLAERMKTAIDPMLGANGSIKHRTDGLQDSIDSLDDQLESRKTAIDAQIEVYRQQFVQLDVLVSQMNSMSSYLTQQFASLSNSTK